MGGPDEAQAGYSVVASIATCGKAENEQEGLIRSELPQDSIMKYRLPSRGTSNGA